MQVLRLIILKQLLWILYYIYDRQQILRRYFERSSQNLILSRLQRMLVPIDMSELDITGID
jgi:hypothetical protein